VQIPVVSDSEDDPDQSLTQDSPSTTVAPTTHMSDQPTESTKINTSDTEPNGTIEEDSNNREHPVIAAFDQEQHDIANDHPTYTDEHQEYMKWHYKLNHASQRVMTKLAHKGMLPRNITKILKTMDKQGRKGPMCNNCYSASATRTPWRTKQDKQKKNAGDRRSSLSPGDVVSVDQLESSTPGFIGQITGMLTKLRIVGSTIFVDQASDFSYVYHHMSLSSEETVKAKQSFEKFARTHGVSIKHYHVDNGRFKDKVFMKEIEDQRQSISFIEVGAHHQNGIAGKRIGALQRRATTLLLHAQRRWPDAINTHLWPYALKAANDSRNNSPTSKYDDCPISRFCKTASFPKILHQHHFGCPVYVLGKQMQDGKKAKKWEDMTRIGVNLGYSPRHASSVSLILNIETGLVSPQYHCAYDDLFETTTGTQARSIPKSKWQQKAGFTNKEVEEERGPNDADQVEEAEDENSRYEGDEKSDLEPTEQETREKVMTYTTRPGRVSRPPERWNLARNESIL